MTSATCFFIAPTGRSLRSLRRYSSFDAPCGAGRSYHDASVPLDAVEGDAGISGDQWPHDDSRWPAACGCGYRFTEQDAWQLHHDREYRRADTGALMTLRSAPPGAIWDATWLHEHPFYVGPDGRSLHVRLPNGSDWCIDGPASNCDQKARPHKCWVRHGEPPLLTVDKKGDTCNAGGGSIWSRQGSPTAWHGFLTNGVLVPC